MAEIHIPIAFLRDTSVELRNTLSKYLFKRCPELDKVFYESQMYDSTPWEHRRSMKGGEEA